MAQPDAAISFFVIGTSVIAASRLDITSSGNLLARKEVPEIYDY
jgi:hypothetical protein